MKTKPDRHPFFTRPYHWLLLLGLTLSYLLATGATPPRRSTTVNNQVKLITLDPGHFHAALIQKEMYPGVSEQVNVYAPLGPDLIAHLERVANFNLRPNNPTHWKLEVHIGPDFMERMLRERPGNVVVVSGRNQGKIDRIGAAVGAGLHVLADKPWIISHTDLPKLEAALNTAEKKGVVAYDIMTERYEITTMLQKELVNDAGTFGTAVASTDQEPGVFMESVHYLMKTVAGVPLLRPAWFFDIKQQGEGLADVGTHLVDLAPWILFPEKPIDYHTDIHVLKAKRWPTVLTKTDFQRVTGEKDFPEFLRPNVKDGQLNYYCNTQVSYTMRGTHVTLKILWDYEASAGAGDTHFAVVTGSKSRVEVRQRAEQKYRPELYVVPRRAEQKAEVLAALQKKVASLQGKFPGIAVEDLGAEMQIRIPDQYRVGHEAHFAQVTSQFLNYLKNPSALPRWEKANMLAKYFVTTKGVELSQ